MAELAKVDLARGGEEAKLRRALLEDLVEYYKGVYPARPLALAVWFGKSPRSEEHNLLVLFTGRGEGRVHYIPHEPLDIRHDTEPLFWKTGKGGPPWVNIHSTVVDYFAELLDSKPQDVAKFLDKFDVLYFNKDLLPEAIIRAFNVIAEPSGLLKGWYVSAHEYEDTKTPKLRTLLARWSPVRPDIGLVKVEESQDFEHCRGLLHMEFSAGAGPRWLPLRPGALNSHSFYNDLQDGRPGYFLFQGGSLYQILKVEVKTAPEYPERFRLLEKMHDDRYPEVSLRAVLPLKQPAA